MELKKKTYITTMPNQIGAFLQASRCFAQLGVNITRVSYNKAVDSHMLFIDAEGTEEQLHQADTLLRGIGYLPQTETAPQIILIAFYLRDVPGAVTEILTLIEQFGFNLSYLSSQADGSGYFGGTCVEAVETLQELGAAAVGINCSTGPDQLESLVRNMKQAAKVPLLVKPNAGMPEISPEGEAIYSMGPAAFAQHMRTLIDAGAALVGGCCGTDPRYISALRDVLPR